MDKRFAIPAGLAIMVALAVIGVMSVLSFTVTRPAEASIQDPAQFDTAKVDLAKLTEPLSTPLQATAQVTGATVTNNPNRPGVASTYTITFTAPAVLNNASSEIVIRLAKEFGVPATIDRNQVSLSADEVTNDTLGQFAGQAVAPLEVTVEERIGEESEQFDLRLRVPDMNTADTSGNNNIAAGADVTVVIRQAAGITNPSEGSNGRLVAVRTVNPDHAAQELALAIPWRIEMSTPDGSRGDTVTLTGFGFKSNQTTTFWLDKNGDGVRDATERDLCSAVANSSFVATCTFNLSNPPFDPGFGLGNCDFPVVSPGFNCNFINARDGVNNRATNSAGFNQTDLDRTKLLLQATVNVSPTDTNVGDRITISLFDYPNNDTIDEILLGGISINAATTPTLTAATSGLSPISSVGQESFTFTIPGTVDPDGAGAATPIRIPTGVQRLVVNTLLGTGDTNRYTNINLGGARLTISHDAVLANQDLTVSGSGFTERGSGPIICVLEDDIRLNNIQLRIDTDSLDATCASAFTSPQRKGVELSSGGTFTATLNVVDTAGNIDVALLTEGSHELKVIDSSGAEGTLNVTIPQRTMEVTPLSARPRDLVTIIGRNFPADNSDVGSVPVTLLYDCGGNNTRSSTVDPDASGNFRETLRIPTNCAIPSTNTITATIGTTNTTETALHEIPDALVRVTPVRGSSGGVVTVTGEGFRTFESVASVDFGGRGTLGGRTVNTDANGDFTIDDLVVPGLDIGVHAVIVRVGTSTNRVTSSTSFEVLEASGIGGATTTPIEDALKPLFDGETLDRVFFFNNTTKEWLFYINDEAFESANDLDDVASGLPIWIKVTEDTSVELNGQTFPLSCVNPGTPEEDCWNLIVFP